VLHHLLLFYVLGSLSAEVQFRVEERIELEEEYQRLLSEKKKVDAALASLTMATRVYAEELDAGFVGACAHACVCVLSVLRSSHGGTSALLLHVPYHVHGQHRSILFILLALLYALFHFDAQTESQDDEDRSLRRGQQASAR
jgi:hypothetical protein